MLCTSKLSMYLTLILNATDSSKSQKTLKIILQSYHFLSFVICLTNVGIVHARKYGCGTDDHNCRGSQTSTTFRVRNPGPSRNGPWTLSQTFRKFSVRTKMLKTLLVLPTATGKHLEKETFKFRVP